MNAGFYGNGCRERIICAMVLGMVKSMESLIKLCGRMTGVFHGPWHSEKEQDVYWHSNWVS